MPDQLHAYRLEQLEQTVSKLTEQSVALQTDVRHLKDAMDAAARETFAYRRDTKRDLKCIADSWHEFQGCYGPMLKEIRQARADRKKTRMQLMIAWLIAAGVSAWHLGAEWLTKHLR